MVFQELAPSQSHKIKSRNDLESELFGVSETTHVAVPTIRDNEGEAAEQGVYFDDSQYDYMQHIRDLDASTGSGESYFVEAVTKKPNGKGKAKVSLEDALRSASLQGDQNAEYGNHYAKAQLLDEDSLPSKSLKKGTYQEQQDIPDTLAGFQPDMDPRLREVLEALDDDAYVDDEEEFFGEIARDGEEVNLDEFIGTDFAVDGGDDAGWETDDTEKPHVEYNSDSMPPPSIPQSTDTLMEETPDHGDGDWMKNFSKFKQAENVKNTKPAASFDEFQSSIMTGTSMTGGRRKKRKGAMTSSTGYSMTSSSLFRTEGQTLLDARFDKIEEDYAEDEMEMEDGASVMTGTLMAPGRAPPLAQRSDFNDIMDEFLGSYSMNGKKRMKKGKYQSGIEQLDEVRKELGPARLKPQKA